MEITRNDVLFFLSLIGAVWFSYFGMIWVYWIALIMAYPFGLISFVLWWIIRKENKKRTKLIPILLSIGLLLSLFMLANTH